MTIAKLLNGSFQDDKDKESAFMQTVVINGLMFGYPEMLTMNDTHILLDKGLLITSKFNNFNIRDILTENYDIKSSAVKIHTIKNPIYLPAALTVIYPYTISDLKKNFNLEENMMLTELENMYNKHKTKK